nr:hypothetical protein [Dyella sp. C9]
MSCQADFSSAQVSPVVRRPYSTERLSARLLRAASTTPWQIAATGLSAAKNAATTACSRSLSRYSRTPRAR